jgi:hypothetical protein
MPSDSPRHPATIGARHDVVCRVRKGVDMEFGFVARHRGVWAVWWLCEALGVPRSGFHAWPIRAPSASTRSDEVLVPKIRASFVGSDRT